jgi:hypothetical protein
MLEPATVGGENQAEFTINAYAQAAPAPQNDREVERALASIEHMDTASSGYLTDRRLIIQHPETKHYMKLDGDNRKRWIKSIDSARILTTQEFSGMYTYGTTDIIVLLLKEPPEIPGCLLANWFNAGFITLMQDAPNNKVMRAHMMRVLKVDPPSELDDFAKLKDWVEKTFPNPRNKANPAFRRIDNPITGIAPPHGVTVRCRISEVEHGRCNYSLIKSTEQDFMLTVDEVRRAIDEGDAENMSDLQNWVRREVNDREDMCWDYGDEETSGQEEVSVEDRETSMPDGFPETALVRMLRAQAPELLDRLNY